jgi:hypothetical protein
MKLLIKTIALSTLFALASCAHHGCKCCGSQCEMHKDGSKSGEQCHMDKDKKDAKADNTSPEKK